MLKKNSNLQYEAIPLESWYKFKPVINYRTLNEEEAELVIF